MKVYTKRIEPLVSGDTPKSCNQCHLSGVDLSMYTKGTPCQSMACLLSKDMVDFIQPQNSKVLAQILMAQPQSQLITSDVLKAEYDGFLEWIEYSAQCHSILCPDYDSPCVGPTGPNPIPPSVLTPIGGCGEDFLVKTFEKHVFFWRERCHDCHSGMVPEFPGPPWLVQEFDYTDPVATEAAALQSMYNLIGLGAVDPIKPLQSLMLLKPLAVAAGGVEHGGGDKLEDIADPAYYEFKTWLEYYSYCFNGLEPQLPQIEIQSPLNYSKFVPGSMVVLKGTATDPQQTTLPSSAFVWTSSIAGEPLAIGPGPILVTLQSAKQFIILTVTDKDGNKNQRAIKVGPI